MITDILNTFRKQAREHKTLRAFYYDRNYELGSGNTAYPLLWLEEPVIGRNRDNVFLNSANFSILFVPKSDDDISELQDTAFSIGLNILERIKADKDSIMGIRPDWSFLTLRNYYDDNAAGCRFSINFTMRNMQDLCLIDEQFDADAQFDESKPLKDFNVSPAGNCEVFTNKFPVFGLKTRKR